MNEWTATLSFGEPSPYETKCTFWARNEKEARAYVKKHFPRATVLSFEEA